MIFKTLNRIAHSRNVAITLGPKHFQLAPDDIESLARMTTYVASAEAEVTLIGPAEIEAAAENSPL